MQISESEPESQASSPHASAASDLAVPRSESSASPGTGFILSDGCEGTGKGKPKFRERLPGYFFTHVKVILNDCRSYYDSFLILLAKRFNSAYYLLLIPGK